MSLLGRGVGCPLTLTLILSGPLCAAAQDKPPLPGVEVKPAALRLCYSTTDAYPWRTAKGEGTNFILLARVSAVLATPFTYEARGFSHCLAALAEGSVDGVIGVSYRQDRIPIGVYPHEADGRPAPDKNLYSAARSLFRLKASSLGWDGHRFQNLSGPIAASGQTVGDLLRTAGAQVVEVAGTGEPALEMVLAATAQAAVFDTEYGDRLLRANPRFAQAIERLPVPLSARPYYLMVSHQFEAAYPAFVQSLWSAVKRNRESAGFQNALRGFLAQP